MIERESNGSRRRTHRGPRALGFALLAAGAATACGESPGAEAAPAGGAGPGSAPTAVTVETVRTGSIARTVGVAGVVEPIRTVGVNAQLSGALVSVDVQEGDRVHVGQVLARLDDREIGSQLAAAEANLEVVQAAYDRAEQLRERQVITQAEFDRERAALAAAEATRDQLAMRAGFASVDAPVAGVVTEKLVEAGDVVGVQTRLFTVADMSILVVRVGVSELDVVQVQPGDPVKIALDALPGREFRGTVRRVFPTADPRTRLVPVEVALEASAAAAVRPGFLARASFALGTRDGVLLVPAGALVSTGSSEAVFVVTDDGSAVRRPVATGLTSEGMVEVIEGLDPGERIVVQGAARLRDGAQVRVVEPRPAMPDSAGAAPGSTGEPQTPTSSEEGP
jgi:RND family efflux transporter MFP subunit